MKHLNKRENNKALRFAKKIMAVELLGGSCIYCGFDNFFALDFHHVQSDKENSISVLRKGRWSNVAKELGKCVILCANCHAEFHCVKSPNYKQSVNKLKKLNLFHQMRCEKCNYVGKNLSSLSFHHVRDKNFSVNAALYHELPRH